MVFRPNHPIGSISIHRRYGQQPKTRIRSKHLQKVLIRPHVIDVRPSVGIPLPFQIIQSGRVGQNQFDMEAEEHGNDDEEGSLDGQAKGPNDKAKGDSFLVVDQAHDILDEEWDFNGKRKDEREDNVEEKQHEKFAITEPHAVGDPRAVVIHVQNAPLASRAVVASESHIFYRSGLKLWQSKQ